MCFRERYVVIPRSRFIQFMLQMWTSCSTNNGLQGECLVSPTNVVIIWPNMTIDIVLPKLITKDLLWRLLEYLLSSRHKLGIILITKYNLIRLLAHNRVSMLLEGSSFFINAWIELIIESDSLCLLHHWIFTVSFIPLCSMRFINRVWYYFAKPQWIYDFLLIYTDF